MFSRSESHSLSRLRGAVNKLREAAHIISPPPRRDSGIGSPTISEAPEIDSFDALLLQIVEAAHRFEALHVNSQELGEKNTALVAQCDKSLEETDFMRLRAIISSKRQELGAMETKLGRMKRRKEAEERKWNIEKERHEETKSKLVALERKLNIEKERHEETKSTLAVVDTKLDQMKWLKETGGWRWNIEKERHEETKNKLVALKLQQEQYLVALRDVERMETRLQTLVGPTPTPRSILISTVVESSTRGVRLADPPDEEVLPENCSVKDLSYKQLNVFLNPDQVRQFLDSISGLSEGNQISKSLRSRICAMCKKPKFIPAAGQIQNNWKIYEFPRDSGEAKCCISGICLKCWANFFRKAIQNDWWHNLESRQWLRYPLPLCKQSVKVWSGAQLSMQLSELDGIDVSSSVEMFEIGNILHSELQNLYPRPSPPALEAAYLLHIRQVEYGHMYSFFDKRFKESEPDKYGRIQRYKPGKVVVGKLDDGDLMIPIFTKVIRRSNEPRECSLCAECYYDVNFESEEKWEESCLGFEGSWIWKLLLFPTKKMLGCGHDVTACKRCHEKHLATQLEERGRNGCDLLSCAECNRILEHNEVQALASEETAKLIDHYKFLNYISTQPNFRWCLRSGCTIGALYESDDPHITCVCNYQMCFNHQIAWHFGLNCTEYDNMRRHGDPDFQGTQDEIQRATKACPGPGCGVRIQKNDGCSHMRCTSCNAEFCWTCMRFWTRGTPYEYQHGCRGF